MINLKLIYFIFVVRSFSSARAEAAYLTQV